MIPNSSSSNTEYSQLAQLGAYLQRPPEAGREAPLAAWLAVATPDPEPHVDAYECPNTEYAQLASLGRMLEAQRRAAGR